MSLVFHCNSNTKDCPPLFLESSDIGRFEFKQFRVRSSLGLTEWGVPDFIASLVPSGVRNAFLEFCLDPRPPFLELLFLLPALEEVEGTLIPEL